MIEEILRYALSFLGVPYIFNGKNRLTGMDCSGFVSEVLRGFGLVRNFETLNAAMLYDRFAAGKPTETPRAGSLLFFGKSEKAIDHVAIAVSETRMIECGGGDHTTTDVSSAAKHAAMVRYRPISLRIDFVKAVMPPWPTT